MDKVQCVCVCVCVYVPLQFWVPPAPRSGGLALPQQGGAPQEVVMVGGSPIVAPWDWELGERQYLLLHRPSEIAWVPRLPQRDTTVHCMYH